MYINNVTLNNFRAYKGKAFLKFNSNRDQNVSIISGNNGYGKTSLLTALLWCLYGKLIIDVDEQYRKNVRDAGGYKHYCRKLMNILVLSESKGLLEELRLKHSLATNQEQEEFQKQIDELTSFSVTISFSKIFIPAFPCNTLEITRTYNSETDKEDLTILIDGKENELTKHVGLEIFINDFVLRKEIAKFFFFDAEKIVALAEIHSIQERKNLSQAYTEVLGIKKYLDLKENLENLRLRLRKKTIGIDESKWQKMLDQQLSIEKLQSHNVDMIREKESELILKQSASDKLQERLIREGSAITLEELKELKQLQENLMLQGNALKSRLKEIMDLAPFSIAGNMFFKVKQQLELEREQSELKKENTFFKRKLLSINKAFIDNQNTLRLSEAKRQIILDLIESKLIPKETTLSKSLLSFSPEKENEFLAVYDNLQLSYSKSIKSLFKELKVQISTYATVNKRISDAESKAQDPVVQTIRADKEKLDKEIDGVRKEIIELKAANLNLQSELTKVNAQLSELKKKRDVAEQDREKDETTARLIHELTAFISKLRLVKKRSLEENILKELHILMHKSNFVNKVEVKIDGELIDIELYDIENRTIDKDNLSKGEQQLYASAVLKALVKESNIRFPVFIDSPLQKFDKEHAKNIIQDFYPNISAQVVLFPLLEKEFSQIEYNLLRHRVANVYLIEHHGHYHSSFKLIKPENLFEFHQDKLANV